VLGRHGEGPGRATLRTHVRVDGRPVLRSETRLGAGAAEFASPAGMAAKRVHGAALAVLPAYAAEPATAAAPDAWSARFPLAGPAAAGVALGDTAAEVAARLDALAVA